MGGDVGGDTGAYGGGDAEGNAITLIIKGLISVFIKGVI